MAWDVLPIECRHQILSFLPLKDCLHYAAVSKECLLHTVEALRGRRRDQFLSRHAYTQQNPSRLLCIRPGDDLEGMLVLPSVLERLKALHRIIPAGHSRKAKVWALICNLQYPYTPKPCPFQELRAVCRAHKYHHSVLSTSTIHWKPPPPPLPGDNGLNVEGFSVSLDQYLGDVYVISTLMVHVLSRLVDHGGDDPSVTFANQWMQQPREAEELKGYSSFLLLHSIVLAYAPMSKELMASIYGHVDEALRPQPNNNLEVSNTFSPFYLTRRVMSRDGLAMATLGEAWTHKTLVASFGPLGPAFRGRDRLALISMDARFLFDLACHCLQKVCLPLHDSRTLSWMKELHTEGRNTRPMTVSSPIVSISSPFER